MSDTSGTDRELLIAELEPVTIYTVARWPVTAGAKRAAGYTTHRFEFVAKSSSDALAKAVKDCKWRDPRNNFRFQVVSTRVVIGKGGK